MDSEEGTVRELFSNRTLVFGRKGKRNRTRFWPSKVNRQHLLMRTDIGRKYVQISFHFC